MLSVSREYIYRKVGMGSSANKTEELAMYALWTSYYKKPHDELRDYTKVWDKVKQTILSEQWFDVLDVIEETAGLIKRSASGYIGDLPTAIISAYNACFEKYLVAYRFIEGELVPIDSTQESEAIATALADSAVVPGARHALDKALGHLADRQNPDYANSMKESISAVEAIVRKVAGEGTLGAGLRKLENAGLKIHPALEQAWSKMYGYTSNESGLRHAGIDAASVDQALAKYLLVTCSAFVSYLTEEGRKANLVVT